MPYLRTNQQSSLKLVSVRQDEPVVNHPDLSSFNIYTDIYCQVFKNPH